MIAVEQALTNGQLLVVILIGLGIWVLWRMNQPRTRHLPVATLGDEAQAWLDEWNRNQPLDWQQEGWA